MSPIYCPYCLHPAENNQIMYRCLTEDPECAAPFLAGRQNPRSICPNCGLQARRRVCPHPKCRHDLPAAYCSSGTNRIIPVFGAVNSGKSTYLAVLLHEIRNRLVRELNANFTYLDDPTKRQYDLLKRRLFREGLVLPATTAGQGLTPTSPFVSRLALNGSNGQALNLVFFDAAGEDMAEKTQRERYSKYLNAADGVVFIVDHEELSEVGGDLAHSPVQEAAPDSSAGEHTVVQLTQLLQELRRTSSRRAPLPACLVLSKIDALPAELSRNTAISRLPRPGAALDREDRAAVHDEVYALLHRWNFSSLTTVLESQYERSGLFAMSALGAALQGEEVDPAGVRPHRVTDPLIWLLAEFGFIPRH